MEEQALQCVAVRLERLGHAAHARPKCAAGVCVGFSVVFLFIMGSTTTSGTVIPTPKDAKNAFLGATATLFAKRVTRAPESPPLEEHRPHVGHESHAALEASSAEGSTPEESTPETVSPRRKTKIADAQLAEKPQSRRKVTTLLSKDASAGDATLSEHTNSATPPVKATKAAGWGSEERDRAEDEIPRKASQGEVSATPNTSKDYAVVEDQSSARASKMGAEVDSQSSVGHA